MSSPQDVYYHNLDGKAQMYFIRLESMGFSFNEIKKRIQWRQAHNWEAYKKNYSTYKPKRKKGNDRMTIEYQVPEDLFQHLLPERNFKILQMLAKDRQIVSDIARELNVNKSSAFHAVRKLEKAGLVQIIERESDDNQKNVYWGLTAKAKAIMRHSKIVFTRETRK